MRREECVDIGAEPIDSDLKACILAELATQPGAASSSAKAAYS
jgi:hypothetical protein